LKFRNKFTGTYKSEKRKILLITINYLEKNIEKTGEREVNSRCESIQKENDNLKEEIQRLKSLLNTDNSNSGIPTSKTPIGKNKRIPNSREKTGEKIGGQTRYQKHKLEKFHDEGLTDSSYYEV